MLVGFTCENYVSFRTSCVLSMQASAIGEHVETHTLNTPHGRLLKSSLVYGANAAGKSNLLKAMWFMRQMVLHSVSVRGLAAQAECFKFIQDSEKRPSVFEVSFITGTTLYRYGFQLLGGRVDGEWLYRKAKRESLLFERSGPSWSTIELKGPLKTLETIKSHTREDALFVTVAALFNNKVAKDVMQWLESVMILTPHSSPVETFKYMEDGEQNRRAVLKYLQQADTGIENVLFRITDTDSQEEIVHFGDDFSVTRVRKTREVDLKTRHALYSDNNERVASVDLPFDEYQSAGTIALFEMLGPVLRGLQEGRLVIIDELGSRLHPSLTRFTLSLFHSLDLNPSTAQLICNTHDVLLLDEDIRRDQVWFVQKNPRGESELYSLHDFADIRKDEFFRKKYLLGVFGAIPRLESNAVYE